MRASKYTEIGKNGTISELTKAFNKAAVGFYSDHPVLLDKVTAGAMQAFNEGRPENIQILLQKAKDTEFKGFGNSDYYYYNYFIALTLFKLSENSDDKKAVTRRLSSNAPLEIFPRKKNRIFSIVL